MKYINTATGAYPVSEGEVRAAFPNVSFPNHPIPFPVPEGFAEVVSTPRPPFDFSVQTLEEAQPERINGVWHQRWAVKNRPVEIAAANVRGTRDEAIANSDWTQLADVDLTTEQRDAWTKYRKALRDLTKQPGFPWSTNWPVKP
jgi:hypothetical protein